MNPWPYPLWIAHRGAGKLAPENTLAAFRAGAAHGYRAFECDVKLSADGVPFLLHDATLQRTSNGPAALAPSPNAPSASNAFGGANAQRFKTGLSTSNHALATLFAPALVKCKLS
mgnify:CR=1 FL=1